MYPYPNGWTAPNKGVCEKCGIGTMAHDPRWLCRCPLCWQALMKFKL